MYQEFYFKLCLLPNEVEALVSIAEREYFLYRFFDVDDKVKVALEFLIEREVKGHE